MKQLTASLRRTYSLGIIVLFVALIFAIIGLTTHSPDAVLAQPTLQQQTTLYYWGTDSGAYVGRTDTTDPIIRLPHHGSTGQDFYIGRLGGGANFAPQFCTNALKTIEGIPYGQTHSACNIEPIGSVSLATQRATYAYWHVIPYMPTVANCLPIIGNKPQSPNAYTWGRDVADYLIQKVQENSNYIGGRVIFGDFENFNSAAPCPWTSGNVSANRDVVRGFLDAVAETQIPGTTDHYMPGIYTNQSFWPSYLGSDFIPLQQQTQTPQPFVLWLAWEPKTPEFNTASTQFDANQVLTTGTEKIWPLAYGGQHPVIWQFNGDRGNVTLQDPVAGFNPVGAATNVDAVLIIDSSGSMSTNDPQDKRKEASRIFVSNNAYKNDYVGVVDFDHAIEATTSLQLLPDNKGSVIAAISAIDASGGTDIGIGVQSGCDILNLSNRSSYGKGAILLTDGDGAFAGQDQCFKAKGWPIFAFGFGSANDTLLQQIASNTGGTYTRVTNLTSLTCEFIRVRSLIANVVPPPCGVSHVPQLATVALIQTIAFGQGQATFSTGWPGSDVVMTLTSPSGRVIDRNTVAPDVNHENGATYEIYTIAYPEPGEWQVNLYGASVPVSGEDVVFGFASIPEPVMGSLTLTPIVDARVKQEDPASNYGTSGMLDADGSSGNVVQSYLRFNVSGVTGPLKRAVLRLREASNGTANGPQLFTTSNAWEETTITWNNRPTPVGTALANAGVISVGTWVEYDITAFVTSNGIYNFVLIPDSTDGVEFSSRQGDALPELVLTLAQDSMPNPRPFGAQADARVRQGNPTTNYGTSSRLDADGSTNAVVQSYLRFNVSDLTSPVQHAVLRLQATSNGTANGPQLFATSSAWEETTITWNNRPAPVGTVLGNIGIISPNTWIEYDVTALVTGNGTYNFVLIPESSDGVEFSSRQGDGMPQLLITVAP